MARAFGHEPSTRSQPRIVLASRRPQRHAAVRHAGGRSGPRRPRPVLDAPLGNGHVVMFAIRPFWRWQSQGTFFLGFNAILNWNDLDAGKPAKTETNQQP